MGWQGCGWTTQRGAQGRLEPWQPSRKHFLQNAAAYNLWFRVATCKIYKSNKTRFEIIHERDPSINPKTVLLPPVFLDELYNNSLDN